MKIALTLPALPLSGIGTSVAIIEAGLKEHDHNVDIILTGYDTAEDMRFAENAGWNVVVPGKGIRYLPKRLKTLATYFNTSDYQLLINNTSIETQCILPSLRPKLLRIAVLRVLNQEALSHVAHNSEYLHGVVGISQEMVRVMEQNAAIKAPVFLIPNCTTVTGGEFPEIKKHLNIGFVGRLSETDKNVSILPLIMEALRGYDLHCSLDIIGEGPARCKLENEVARSGLENVKFYGRQTRAQVNRLMSNMHFILLPSVHEGLSNVMLEGMAIGSLPICSDIENFKWVLGKAASKLQCQLHKPEDYAEKISYFVKNTDSYREVQQYLKQRQQRLFNPEYTISLYCQLIESLSTRSLRHNHTMPQRSAITVPKGYKRYCTPLWYVAQRLKDFVTLG